MMALSRSANVALDFAAWAVVHAATGKLAQRLPDRLYHADGWLWRERGFEDGGRLYLRLGIRRWKHLLPDAGGCFAGGFPKRRLAASSPEYLATFTRETRRAELGHWMALACAPLFALWNPLRATAWLALYALAANGPCILAQRYNRIRLARVAARRLIRA